MIDQADDLRKLLASFSKTANAPLAEKKRGGGDVHSGSGFQPLESRCAEQDALCTAHNAPFSKARVLSITSGKGGVGKTNVAVNLAYALTQINKKAAPLVAMASDSQCCKARPSCPKGNEEKKRNEEEEGTYKKGMASRISHPAFQICPLTVLIIDADLGLANVNILLGVTSKWTLQHVIHQEKSIAEVIVTTPDGLRILPASSGIEEMTHLTVAQKLYLKSQFDLLDSEFDFILIDTAAGIGSNVMSFNQMAQEVIVILSPDPTSLADAYATIKVLSTKYGVLKFHVIVNNTQNASHGRSLYQKLEKICHRFLKIPIQHLGTLSADPHLVQASRNQQVVVKHFPKAKISLEIQKIAESVSGIPYDPWSNKSINFLLNNVLKLGQE